MLSFYLYVVGVVGYGIEMYTENKSNPFTTSELVLRILVTAFWPIVIPVMAAMFLYKEFK
jgi:hypothetical protein